MSSRILTDIIEPRAAKEWANRTALLPGSDRHNGIVKVLIGLIYLFFTGRSYDVIVLSGNRMSMIFACVTALSPLRYPPQIFVDCLWYLPNSALKLRLKKLQLRLVSRSVTKFIVWSSHEIVDYALAFGIAEEKFEFIPHHHSLENYDFKAHSGDYIFTGGDGDRDYPTLLEAVKGLEIQLKIATRRTDWAGDCIPPPNVQAFPTSSDDFRKCMAEAKIVIVPMRSMLLHSGGQQTYLNAMAMGKPVVVAGVEGASDYIQDGVNGLLVQAGDAVGLRKAIESLLNDQDKRENIAKNASAAFNEYTTIRCLDKITELADRVADIAARR